MSATRLTCFSLISAIEQDLRSLLCDSCQSAGLADFLPPDMRKIAADRRTVDLGTPSGPETSDFTLIDYLDFGHLSQLLNLHKPILPRQVQDQIGGVAQEIGDLVSIRNRVCHSRPLEFDDFQRLHDFGVTHSKDKEFPWNELRSTIALIGQNPTSVLHVQIPTYWADRANEIFQNLPQPDFDDTGFIGRRQDVQNIQKLIAGPYPVISIIGEGGVGKTALAVKTLYDLLESNSREQFDAIVWVSLKTAVLTASGVETVRGAITDTLGLFGAIASSIGSSDDAPRLNALLNEVREFMEQFRVLLALDNLETVSQEELVSFLREIPLRSKVLITSRIGLGQLEHPYPLAPMDKTDASRFIRRAAMAQNLKEIVTAKQEVVDRWCQKLLFNPLALKWFVSSVSLGRAPEDLLNRSGDSYQTLLKFSFENLYNSLPSLAQALMIVCHVAGRPLSKTELAVLVDTIASQKSPDEIELALRTLVHSSVLQRLVPKEPSAPSQYQLGTFAREYLSYVQRPSRDITTKVTEGQRWLKVEAEGSARRSAYYKYDQGAIHCTTKDERLVGAKLRQSRDLSREGRHAEAEAQLVWAERMLPAFSEVKRIKALNAIDRGDFLEAKEAYEEAIDLDPKSAICRFAYARLLHYDFEDFDAAIEQAEKLVQASPTDIPPRSLLAMALTRRGRFAEASSIYDSLISGMTDIPPRHRTAICDQAAETYRRWAEQDSRSSEAAASRLHLERAISIAVTPLSWDGWVTDQQIENRIGEIVCSIVSEGIRIRDDRLLDAIFGKFDGELRRVRVKISPRQPYEVIRELFWQSKCWPTLDAMLSRNKGFFPASTAADGTLTGIVKATNSAGRYGFVTTADGKDWFFHRTNLEDPSLFDDIRPGLQMSFVIGSNSKGECADRCRCIPEVGG